MSSMDEVYIEEVFQALSIGLVVTNFLLNTNRVVKAIKFCQECFFIFGSTPFLQQMKKFEALYEEMHRTALIIRASCNVNCFDVCNLMVSLAALYLRQCKYIEAKELLERAQIISTETDDKNGEAVCLQQLGIVCQSTGEYEKAKEYHIKVLEIRKEIGGKKELGSCYGNLGVVYQYVGDYEKAKEYHELALEKSEETGDKRGEGIDCANLANTLVGLGYYEEAHEYLQRALYIKEETGDRLGEGTVYANLGSLFIPLGDYNKAKEYCEKALKICLETGEKTGEVSIYGNLGTISSYLNESVEAEKWFKKGLAISEEIGNLEKQMYFLGQLAWTKILERNFEEAWSYLYPSIERSENLRGFLRNNDLFKIAFLDQNVHPYWSLIEFFCATGSPVEALRSAELGRTRALADMMKTQYLVQKQPSFNPQSWKCIENATNKEQNCTFLYFYQYSSCICQWVIQAGKVVYFRKLYVDETHLPEGSDQTFDTFLNTCRSLGVTSEENCEDRSLRSVKPQEGNYEEASRIGQEDERDSGVKIDLSLGYKLLIAPVKEFLKGHEIIIVPDRSLYNVPFAALPDESGKCLAETFRIRVVPSLTILKLIQESPADYHSQTGALIVGNPDVGKVRDADRKIKNIAPLPFAEIEAKMVAEKLGVSPLLGKEPTKQAVLQKINSVSLLHFAAHGDAETGEIALAPAQRIPGKIPQEKDWLLTMSDISNVRLRAKLVVLSCCHSARGKIKIEGVVGIARAFLGSGARSVLVALWAVDDRATEPFMSRFYEHLVRGESASESLHEAMKWMRCNGYSEVRHWAPFMLIGDNVAFDFGKSGDQSKI